MLFNNTNMRTAMAYTNAVGDKVYPIIVDIKKGIKSTEEVSFVSSDINTGILSVAFIQGNDTYNVEGAEVICSIMRPDTTTLEIPCNIINGNTIEVPLGVNGTSQDGVYSFDFKVFKGGNKIVGTPIMNYSVSLSISNDLVVEEDDRLPVLTMLMTQLTELKEETRETINQANVATVASREATANAIEATNNANAVSERVSQETATAISEIRQDTANAIASMEQNTSTAISTMNQNTANAIANVNATSDTMVENVNNAISSMDTTVNSKISEMTNTVNNKISEMNTTVNNKISEVDTAKNDMINDVSSTKANMVTEVTNAKNEMTTTVTNKVNEVEGRFNALTASQQQSSEVIDARDGETSLKARLDRDIEKAKQIYASVEGSNISTDSSVGYAKDVEILGNTIQDASNLADIRSVGDKVEGQELYEIIVESVKADGNLIPLECKVGELFKVYIPKGEYTTSCKSSSCTIRFYRKDKSLIDYWTLSGKETIYRTFTTPEDIYYVLFDGDENTTDIQVIKGNTLKPYAPYQSDKLTILSPVQLEKVGNVADGIVCKDGVWGVEKNTNTLNLVPSEFTITKYRELNSVVAFNMDSLVVSNIKTSYDKGYSNNFIIGGSLGGENSKDRECISIRGAAGKGITIYINKDKLKTLDVAGLTEWLNNNPTYVKYPTTQPQFIPLPHSQQVKLRTFANKTNISFGCEIEGTIKAQVPKSLGATVNTHTEQINNLNNELNRVKKLEESTVSTVETESDFTTVEATSNGYFEDVKLEGKTLVNIRPNNGYSLTFNYELLNTLGSVSYNNLKPDTVYTYIVLGDCNNFNFGVYDYNNNKLTVINSYSQNSIGTFKPLSTTETRIYTRSSVASLGEKTHKFILLEGDHTQNPPSYFEGLKSVGQSATEDGADEIVVSSVNENLLPTPYHETKVTSNGVTYEVMKDENIIVNGTSNTGTSDIIIKTDTDKFKLPKGDYTIYIEGSKKPYIVFNREDCGYQFGHTIHFTVTDRNTPFKYIRIRTDANVTYNNEKIRLVLVKGHTPKEQPIYQSDKKRLLYYNNETQAWEKPILREWDSIEKHADGKYYYHQRSAEVVLNGSENWAIDKGLTSTIRFFTTSMPNGYSFYPICDKFIYVEHSLDGKDYELCGQSAGGVGYFEINILKSKLSTQDVQGFKQWLQANNVTVVYQLAEEKVYECTNIDLITYANETNYVVESGAIVPRTTLKVHNNISNVVKILQEKVSLLENKFIQGLKQVLAGDMYSLAELLYPEDFEEVETENNIMLLPLE